MNKQRGPKGLASGARWASSSSPPNRSCVPEAGGGAGRLTPAAPASNRSRSHQIAPSRRGEPVGICKFKVSVPDWGWRAAKNARAWSAGDASCLCALWTRRRRARSPNSPAVSQEDVPPGSPWSWPDAIPKAGLLRLEGSATPGSFYGSQGTCFSKQLPGKKFVTFWPNFAFYLLECPRIDKGKHIHTSTILPFRKHSYSNPSILGFS